MCTKTRGTHARTRRAQPEARVLSRLPHRWVRGNVGAASARRIPQPGQARNRLQAPRILAKLPRELRCVISGSSSLGARPSIGVLSRTGVLCVKLAERDGRRWPPSLTDLDKEIGHLTPVPCGLRAVFCCPTCKLQQAGQQEGDLLCCGHLKLNDSACLPDASHLTPWRS